MRAARSSARSRVTALKAFSLGSSASIRASAPSQISTAERSPRHTASRTSRIVSGSAHPMTRGTSEETGLQGRVRCVHQGVGALERWADLVGTIGGLLRKDARM